MEQTKVSPKPIIFRMSSSGKCPKALSAEPTIGEVRTGYELGHNYCNKSIYAQCIKCGEPRWTPLLNGKPKYPTCAKCRNEQFGQIQHPNPAPRYKENHPRWKGGRLRTTEGYILVHVETTHPFYCMARKSLKGKDYIFEHRLVMAKHLERPLLPRERVHHLNGIKDDNRIENLELISDIGAHISLHNKGYREGYCKGYQDGQETRIQDLMKEIRLLRWELKQYMEGEIDFEPDDLDKLLGGNNDNP